MTSEHEDEFEVLARALENAGVDVDPMPHRAFDAMAIAAGIRLLAKERDEAKSLARMHARHNRALEARLRIGVAPSPVPSAQSAVAPDTRDEKRRGGSR